MATLADIRRPVAAADQRIRLAAVYRRLCEAVVARLCRRSGLLAVVVGDGARGVLVVPKSAPEGMAPARAGPAARRRGHRVRAAVDQRPDRGGSVVAAAV